jgi:hypothetical protein
LRRFRAVGLHAGRLRRSVDLSGTHFGMGNVGEQVLEDRSEGRSIGIVRGSPLIPPDSTEI